MPSAEGQRAEQGKCAQVPTAVQLLGQRLVLWRDAAQQWRCFEDKCPHRLAPLSGIVQLLCCLRSDIITKPTKDRI